MARRPEDRYPSAEAFAAALTAALAGDGEAGEPEQDATIVASTMVVGSRPVAAPSMPSTPAPDLGATAPGQGPLPGVDRRC